MRITLLLVVALLVGGCAAKGSVKAKSNEALTSSLADHTKSLKTGLADLIGRVKGITAQTWEREKSGILASLSTLQKTAETTHEEATEVADRIKDQESTKSTLEKWGKGVLIVGILMTVVGVYFAIRNGKDTWLGIGVTTIGGGLLLLAFAWFLFWFVVGAALLFLALVSFLLWRNKRVRSTAGKVIKSIAAGREAGVVEFSGDRKALTDVLDPIQGPDGKALVDEFTKEA